MKIVKKVFQLLVTGVAAGLLFIGSPVWAEEGGGVCPPGSSNPSAATAAECNLPGDDDGSSLMGTVGNLIQVIVGVLGVVAVLVIILGGVQYTTSAGDAGKAKKAKDTILYGIIGLVVALLAYAIVNFVLASLSGEGDTDGGDGSITESSVVA